MSAPLLESAEALAPPTMVGAESGFEVPAAGGKAARRRRPGALWAGLAGLLVGVLAAIACAVAFLVGLAAAYDGRVLPGVRVGGVSLAGLDRPAALARLQEELPPVDAGQLVLRVEGVPHAVPLGQVERRYRLDEAVDAALGYGRQGSLVERAEAEARAAFGGVEVRPALSYDASALSASLMEEAFAAARSPQDAATLPVPGTPWFVVAPDRPGRHLDLGETRAALDAALLGPARGDVVVDAAVVTVTPDVTQAMAQQAMSQAMAMASSPLTLRSGSRTWRIARATVASWLTFELDRQDGYVPRVDTTRVGKSLASLAKAVAKPAKDAVFVTVGGKIVGVIASAKGARLDVAVTAARMAAAVTATASGGKPGPVDLAVASVAPSLDSAQAASYLPRMVLLGSWTTHYVPSEHNFFGANIRIPTTQINGYVVMPGAWFDFWRVVRISTDLGFGPGGFIRNGHSEPTGALGGGICSVSTTLFNAALRSGLQMGARSNHYYYITRYPVGLDATVWIEGGHAQTMSFRNDTGYPVLIRGLNGAGTVTFQIYGVPDGRRVLISKPTIADYVGAGDDVQYTSALRRGVSERVEWPADGFRAWVTVTVVTAQGAVLHRTTYYSNYARVNGLVLVGTG